MNRFETQANKKPSNDKERILRKTLEIIERPIGSEKTFTTKPLTRRKKKGHRLVRRTAQELVDSWYPETDVAYEAMDKRLLTQFERCDKKTRLAYLGRPATRQVERVEQEVQYRKTGTVTYKDHTFTHKLPAKKGYLELFGVATLYTDKNGKAWFRICHYKQTELIPPKTALQSISEDLSESDSKKISLPLNRLRRHTTEQLEVKAGHSGREKRESILTERENRSSESNLTLEELRILQVASNES